jgi:uncharacterized membrane protein
MNVWPISEWIALLLRWVHVIAAMAWVGASFYFIALDAGLKRDDTREPGVSGEAWQVHSGGFYRIRKYLAAPVFLPKELTWFKWEAYTTWIFGILLLIVVYYCNPELYLVDRSVADLGVRNTVLIAILSLPTGWLIYDILCRSMLGRHSRYLSLAGFVLLVIITWAFTHTFSGRGAFIQLGALFGTIMVGNVYFVIIPNQTRVVAALRAGGIPNEKLGVQSKQRSVHNNYLTLPVLFLMISNHCAFISSGPSNWVVASNVFVIGFLVRHFFNLRHAGRIPQWWLLPLAFVITLGLMILTLPRGATADALRSPSVRFPEIQRIIATRCQTCHSSAPRFPGLSVAPKGIMFDNPSEIARLAPQIYAQVVASHAMPLNNLTGITDEERQTLHVWISSGAIVR